MDKLQEIKNHINSCVIYINTQKDNIVHLCDVEKALDELNEYHEKRHEENFNRRIKEVTNLSVKIESKDKEIAELKEQLEKLQTTTGHALSIQLKNENERLRYKHKKELAEVQKLKPLDENKIEEIINRYSAYIQEGNDILTELSNAIYETWNTRHIPSVEDIRKSIKCCVDEALAGEIEYEENIESGVKAIHKLIKGE